MKRMEERLGLCMAKLVPIDDVVEWWMSVDQHLMLVIFEEASVAVRRQDFLHQYQL